MDGLNYYQPLFPGDDPDPSIRPGTPVWFDCNGRMIQGVLRHMNTKDRHFGMERADGKNIGHFGWERSFGKVRIFQKTNLGPPPPNRKMEMIARFVDLEDWDDEEEENSERTLRAFLLWCLQNTYDVCRNGARLDMEALLMEYLNR